MNVDNIYTIIFLVIAIVIFLRLRSVLGRRTGNERPPFDPFSRREAPRSAAGGEDKVVSLPRRPAGTRGRETRSRDRGDRPEDQDARARRLDAERRPEGRRRRRPQLRSRDAFLAGARAAYEMIVTAFAEGDRKTLKQPPQPRGL